MRSLRLLVVLGLLWCVVGAWAQTTDTTSSNEFDRAVLAVQPGDIGAKEQAAELKSMADEGDDIAQGLLATAIANGEGGSESATESFNWYKQAAEQGNSDAQFHVALDYYKGVGVDKNTNEAALWWKRSGEKGDAGATWKWLSDRMGDAFATLDAGSFLDGGTGLAKWRKLAETGNVVAQKRLAEVYYDGQGVKEDDAEAVRW